VEQDCIEALRFKWQIASVPDLARRDRMIWLPFRCVAGLLDVKGNRIDQMDRIALVCQPTRIGAGAAPDIAYIGRTGWEMAHQQLLHARKLQATETAGQPSGFRSLIVKRDDFWRRFCHAWDVSG
jgi:hypothetical protein